MQDFDGKRINARILPHCNLCRDCLSESDGCKIALHDSVGERPPYRRPHVTIRDSSAALRGEIPRSTWLPALMKHFGPRAPSGSANVVAEPPWSIVTPSTPPATCSPICATLLAKATPPRSGDRPGGNCADSARADDRGADGALSDVPLGPIPRGDVIPFEDDEVTRPDHRRP